MLQGVSRIVRKHLYLVISVAAALLIIILGGAVAAHNDNYRLSSKKTRPNQNTETVLAGQSSSYPSASKDGQPEPQADNRKSEAGPESNHEDSSRIAESDDDKPAPEPPAPIVEPQPIHIDPPIEVEPPMPYPMPPCGGCGPTLRTKNIACPMTEQMNSTIVCAL